MSCQGMFVSLLSNCLRSCRADSRVHTIECSWCIIVSAQAAAVICSTQAWSLNAARQLLFFLTCIMNIFFFYNVFITSSRKLRRAGCHHVNKKRLFFLFYYELWSFKKKWYFYFTLSHWWGATVCQSFLVVALVALFIQTFVEFLHVFFFPSQDSCFWLFSAAVSNQTDACPSVGGNKYNTVDEKQQECNRCEKMWGIHLFLF